MTTALFPGLATGSAPPIVAIANPPPASASTTSSTDPAATFAALFASVQAAMQGTQAGSPSTDGAPGTQTSSDLLAALFALINGATVEGDTSGTTNALPVLDRQAEVGEPGKTDASAVEALMAYLVMGQQPRVEPAALPTSTGVASDAGVIEAVDPRTILAAVEALLAGAAGEQPVVATGTGVPEALTPVTLEAVSLDVIQAPGDPAVSAQADDLPVVTPATSPAAMVTASAAEPQGTAPAVGGQQMADAGDGEPQGRSDRPGAIDSIEDDSIGGDAAPLSVRTADASAATAADTRTVASASAGVIEAPAPEVRIDAARTVRVTDAAALTEAVADSVQTAVLAGDGEVRLVLNPPELGHLDIRVATGERGLTIRVDASQHGARDLIEQSLPTLHQALEARDLRVDRLEVRAADAGRGGLDTSGSQQRFGGSGQQQGQGDPDWSPLASFEVPGPEKSSWSSRQSAANGRLDVMA